MNFEVRSFNTKDGKQNCFAVRGFKTRKSAYDFFMHRVRNTGALRTRLIENGLPFSSLADEIQLVAYDDNLTWLEQIKHWSAKSGGK